MFRSGNSHKGDIVGEDVVLKRQPFEVSQRKCGTECRFVELKRDNIASSRRFGEFQPA